ncbi:hypothetical protein ACHHYP_08924 [Achlya hypogyna]|uniref:Helicase-associated domain-containing protein n=1 Tax=Achlya hypogyna TaxID=1202772 RepID=A0A1V9ZK20_ACHHY|nr:hypothetical protein ACHHYP_08924 [Achlya hypogyna]
MLHPWGALARTFATRQRPSLLPQPVVNGLAQFRRERGHFVVPSDFIDADALPLGKKLQGLIRKLPTLSPARSQQLQNIGFPTDWHSYYLRTAVIPALTTYKALHDDLNVPQKFTVPTGDPAWPNAAWGLRLGERVNRLRKDKSELPAEATAALDAVGFVWDARRDRIASRTLPALRAYVAITGNTHVPNAFVIPARAPWPAHFAGFKLGHAMMVLKHKHREGTLPSEILAELAAIGLDLEQTLVQTKWNELILPSLHSFFTLHGHSDVPQTFVVPPGDGWPAGAAGLALGRIVRDLRSAGTYAECVERDEAALRALGFIWSADERLLFTVKHRVVPTMAVYRETHGHAFVPAAFVVPAAAPWPRLAHGMKLGLWIARTRVELTDLPHVLQFLLEESGIVWRHFDERFENIILPAVKTYTELHGSCEDIPSSFHVPAEAPWPEATWGLNLGGTLWHIRNGDSYVMDPKKLRALTKYRGIVL